MYHAVKPLQVDEKPPIPGAKQQRFPVLRMPYPTAIIIAPLARPNQRRPDVARRAGSKLSAAAPGKSNDSSDDFGTEREPLLSPADLSNDKGPRPNQSINRLTLHSTYIGSDEERCRVSLCPAFRPPGRDPSVTFRPYVRGLSNFRKSFPKVLCPVGGVLLNFPSMAWYRLSSRQS